MGRLSMRRSPMVFVVELRDVSINSVCELTSTTSLPPATDSVIGNSTNPPTVTETPLFCTLVNPGTSTVTVYVPGGSCRALYPPCPSLVAALSSPLATSSAVTVALVTTFPLGSFTETCRSPVATPPCALAITESSKTKNDTETTLIVRNIRFSLELAKARRRQDNCLRRMADVLTRRLKRLASPLVFISEPCSKTSQESAWVVRE